MRPGMRRASRSCSLIPARLRSLARRRPARQTGGSTTWGFILGRVAADEAEILTLGVARELAAPRHRQPAGREAVPGGQGGAARASSIWRSPPATAAARALYGRLGFQESGPAPGLLCARGRCRRRMPSTLWPARSGRLRRLAPRWTARGSLTYNRPDAITPTQGHARFSATGKPHRAALRRQAPAHDGPAAGDRPGSFRRQGPSRRGGGAPARARGGRAHLALHRLPDAAGCSPPRASWSGTTSAPAAAATRRPRAATTTI